MSTKAIMEEQRVSGMELVQRGFATIKDYKGGDVTICWNKLPEPARQGGLFVLKKGGVEMVLSKHDLQYLLRNV